MLTTRQAQILLYLNDHMDSYCKAGELARLCDVSVRTIKTEIDVLRQICMDLGCLSLVSVPSKGYQLEIYEDEIWQKQLRDWTRDIEKDTSLNHQSVRMKYLILYLLEKPAAVRKSKLLKKLAISESTLYSDLKALKIILSAYQLDIRYTTKEGYRVIGKETDCRRCLIHENIYAATRYQEQIFPDFKKIKEVKEQLIEIFLRYEYKISEVLFENLLIHLLLTLHRIESGHILKDMDLHEHEDSHELHIAQAILLKCTSLHIEELEDEILYLSIHLKGKRDYEDVHDVSEEVNSFIAIALIKIREEFGVDFSGSVDLKVVLALHFVPFLSRVKNNMQLKNCLLSEIKQTFPFAFDIASYFSILIDDKYKIAISEDEMAYFTLYFNYGLESIAVNSQGKRILVISRLKPSETILLRYRINQWFKEQIMLLNFVSPLELNTTNIETYDVLFTTEKADKQTKGAAVEINLFPTEKDFAKMNLAINGYDSVASILMRFSSSLFYYGAAANREEIMNTLISMASVQYHLPNKFKELVMERERLSSTYFANRIAMPHPLYPITSQTFIAVAILKQEIVWEGNHNVRIVMLVATEMNNPKAFQIWPYLSSVVCDEEAVRKVLEETSYEHFMDVLSHYLYSQF